MNWKPEPESIRNDRREEPTPVLSVDTIAFINEMAETKHADTPIEVLKKAFEKGYIKKHGPTIIRWN